MHTQRHQIPLTSPPRKMAWADLGDRPINTQDSKHDNRANAIAAARIVCTHTYWATYRRDRKLELSCAASSGVNMRPTSHALNGLVIPTTSMRRSRFKIPESCSNRVDDPIPTTATQLTENKCMTSYATDHAKGSRTKQTTPATTRTAWTALAP